MDLHLSCIAVVVVGTLISDVMMAQTRYIIKELGTLPGGNASYANGINDAGQVVGFAYIQSGNINAAYPFLFNGSRLQYLGALPGDGSGAATAINNAGQIVGGSSGHPFLFDGLMHDLGFLPGSTSGGRAHAINTAGKVVGESDDPNLSHAFLYDGSMHSLGTLAGDTSSYASGINNVDQIVGGSFNGSAYHAFLYDGTMHYLGTLPGLSDSVATAINNSGQIAGYSWLRSAGSTSNYQPFLYDGSLHRIATPGIQGVTTAISDSGDVVGGFYTSSWHAFIYHGGTVYDLNDYVDGRGSGFSVLMATGINSSGQISAWGFGGFSPGGALLLTPDKVLADLNPIPPNPACNLETTFGGIDVGYAFTPAATITINTVLTLFPSVITPAVCNGGGCTGWIQQGPTPNAVTFEIYEGLPVNGGTLLRSGNFFPVAGTYSGPTAFDDLTLKADTQYFIGFFNVQGLGTGGACNGTVPLDTYFQGAPDALHKYYQKWPTGTYPSLRFIGKATASVGTADNSLITAYNLNNKPLRNDFSGWLGLHFTVGAGGLTVNSLGRIFVPGNSAMHTVKIVRASDGADVPGASVSVSMAGGAAGQFSYMPIPGGPITLPPNSSYHLVSQETQGGDQWYDYGSISRNSLAPVVNNAIYSVDGIHWIPVGGPNTSFVPPNLK